MTMTAPIPVLDLRTAILSGDRSITATVHVTPRPRESWYDAFAAALSTARLAILKNLEPAGIPLNDGLIVWHEQPERHGDGRILTARWTPR